MTIAFLFTWAIIAAGMTFVGIRYERKYMMTIGLVMLMMSCLWYVP